MSSPAQVASSHAAMTAIVRARADSGSRRAWFGRQATRGSTSTWPASSRWSPGTDSTPRPRPAKASPRDWLPFAPGGGGPVPAALPRGPRRARSTPTATSQPLDALGGPEPAAGIPRPARASLAAPPAGAAGRGCGSAFRDRRARRPRRRDRARWCRRPRCAPSTIPVADVFCKFSLNVRITNCVRKNSWYELAGSVALTGPARLRSPPTWRCASPAPPCSASPGYRTAALPEPGGGRGPVGDRP